MLSLNISEKQQLARDLGHIASNIEQHENSFPVRMAKKLGILNSISLRATPTDNHSYEENAQPLSRSRDFRERPHNRYWWHKLERTKYTPLIYSSMTNKEWALMEEWFNDTELKYESTGEANIPPLSLLAGLISGNGISRIVQCGHYVGYSTLVLGFLLKKQGVDKGLFSIDIDAEVTAYTQQWLDQGELNNVVRLHIGDSASDEAAAGAEAYLGDLPQLVFIDSSHQYSHTLKELDLWFDKLAPGGLLVLHDTSAFAAGFDSTEGGGVLKAVIEWCESRAIHPLSINAFVRGGTPGDVPYLDGCGITIIQKPTV
jgi:Methyltransferase domain